MTGFGAGVADLDSGGRLVVELRSVNHRYLDVRVRAPSDQPQLGGVVEETLRKHLDRGRVEAVVRLEGQAAPGVSLDEARARDAFAALARLRDELAPGTDVPLALLGAVPDLFAAPRSGASTDELRDAGARAATGATDALIAMRRREGASLAEDLTRRLAQVRRLVTELSRDADDTLDAWHGRLRERVGRLLEGTGVAVDPQRLAQEVATLAERSDIAEELTRLGSHCDQFGEALAAGDEPVGRRLDFLLQEMNREANTIGSKGADASIAHRVVDLKSELERLREQVQNVL